MVSGQKYTAKGCIEFEPKHGDNLILEGDWKVSVFPGSLGKREFDFRSAMLAITTDPRALLHYACTLTKGLGPVKETEIWEAYGPKWSEQETLLIPGISESIAWSWKDTLRRLADQNSQTQAMAFLLSKGCSMTMANAAWAKWESETLRIVETDCYALTELPHYGFSHVDDSIRVAFGIGDDDLRRVKAAALYVMDQVSSNGDTVAIWSDIAAEVVELIPRAAASFDAAVKELVEAGKMVVMHENLLSLALDWKNDNVIWERYAV